MSAFHIVAVELCMNAFFLLCIAALQYLSRTLDSSFWAFGLCNRHSPLCQVSKLWSCWSLKTWSCPPTQWEVWSSQSKAEGAQRRKRSARQQPVITQQWVLGRGMLHCWGLGCITHSTESREHSGLYSWGLEWNTVIGWLNACTVQKFLRFTEEK